jgi:hypothetical protein
MGESFEESLYEKFFFSGNPQFRERFADPAV